MNIKCLSCQSEVLLKENILLGEVVNCSDCGTDFEVIQTQPLQLGALPEIEEDWGE